VFYLKFAVMPLGPLGFGAITGGIGIGLSAIDIIRGNKMRKEAEQNLKNLNRPMMQVPEAQMQQVALARMMSNQGMPGYQMALGNLGMQNSRAFGQASRAATSSQDLLSVATQLGESSQDQMSQLAMSNAEYQRSGMENYQSQLGNLAQTQQEMFNVNQMQPYQLKYQTYTNNLQQGRDMINSGMQGIGSSIGSAMPFIASGHGAQGWTNFKNFGFGNATGQ
jgi:NAD(P)H-dependent flavin oxidoreductase YrpB (nitropropane dioxygenase family)